MTSDRMLTRIGALLRKAESTDNPHEADAFMAAAQRLASASAIDLAVARAHSSQSRQRPTPVQRVVTIGESGKRGLRTYARLFVSIAAANDVQCDILSDATVIYAYGFAADIDVCETLYSSLLVQMVRECDAYLRTGQHKNEHVVVGRGVRAEVKRVSTLTARLNFQDAFAARIGARLAETRDEVRAEAVRTPGTDVALRDKDVELRDFYRATSRARGTWRTGTSTPSHHARRAGDAAGRRARLGQGVELPGARRRLSS